MSRKLHPDLSAATDAARQTDGENAAPSGRLARRCEGLLESSKEALHIDFEHSGDWTRLRASIDRGSDQCAVVGSPMGVDVDEDGLSPNHKGWVDEIGRDHHIPDVAPGPRRLSFRSPG